jgi:DNA-binding NarL/FixJ family response regulator
MRDGGDGEQPIRGAAPVEPVLAAQVFVAVRQPAIAESLALALNREADIHCRGFATTTAEVARALAEQPTDVLLIGAPLLAEQRDAEMIRRAASSTDVRIVIMALEGISPRWTINPALGTLVPFDAELATLLDTIRRAHSRVDAPARQQNLSDALEELRGQVQLQRTMIRSARARLDAQKEVHHAALKAPLTKRERDVALHLQLGHDVNAISHRLGLSLNTVRGHVKQILWKTDAHSQLEAVAVCVRAGVLKGQNPEL